jgi:hypothetical protein
VTRGRPCLVQVLRFEVVERIGLDPVRWRRSLGRGVIGSLPALVAAVEDALAPFGVRLHDLPLRTEHLVRAHEAIVRSVPDAG